MIRRGNVLLVSFPAFGHYLPTVELAKLIYEFHNVSIAVSAFSLAGVRSRGIPPPSHIPLLPVDDNIKVSFDEVLDIHVYVNTVREMESHYKSFVEDFQSRFPLDAVFWDYALNLPPGFKEWNVPVYIFCSMPATVMLNWLTMTDTTPALPDATFSGSAPEIPVDKRELMPECIKRLWIEKSGVLCQATGMLVNSFYDLEPNATQSFSESPQTANLPLAFVGPILTEVALSEDNQKTSQQIQKWLDKQEKKLIYVSLGTVASTSPQQLREIAAALLSLSTPFIWSLRFSQQVHLPDHFRRHETGDDFSLESPYLILPWVRQQLVLDHPATAVFVSHCGWNSTLEAISYGVPIVAIPQFADQPANAQMVVDLGVGIKLEPLGFAWESRTLTCRELAQAIQHVWETDGVCSRKAKKLSQQAQGARAGHSLRAFVKIMESITSKANNESEDNQDFGDSK